MGTKIQHRRDNPTNWASNNPVLLEGEIAYNTTDKSFRIGDGTNTWSALTEYNYGSLYYMGLWDASSGSYPASPDQGQYYVVSVAGTVSTIIYKIDDWIVYSGVAWQKINNQNGDVIGPAATTENKIPQWDSTTRTLKDGLAIGTTTGTLAAGDDSRFANARTPVAHNLIDTTGHPVTGLTTGHFLKATGATAYGFGAHGLTAPDVGAQAADATLTALAAISTATNKVPYFTAEDAAAVFDLPSNKNYIQNAGFEVNQRQVASVNASGQYAVDRWNFAIGTAAAIISQQTFTPGQTGVPGEPKTYLRCAVSAAGDYASIGQRIESVRTLAGQNAVLSFYAKADSAKTIPFQFVQSFGTGGSLEAYGGITNITFSNTWAKYVLPVTIASISGRTVGAAGNDFLLISINVNQVGTFEFANVKLEAGTVATPFVAKTYAEELQDCLRYAKALGGNTVYERLSSPIGANSTTTAPITILAVPPMRTTPAVIAPTNYANFALWDGTGGPIALSANPAIVSAESSPEVVALTCTVAAGLTVYRPVYLLANAQTTDKIILSAEL